MGKKKVKINFNNEKTIKELDTELLLPQVREELSKLQIKSFIFLDAEEKEISRSDESKIHLGDILDGSNLFLKKEIIKRKMLGEKIESKNGLNFYVYPQKEFSDKEKNRSSNIMVIGETGVGKSTWLHCFINYLQGIEIEEENRYYLFDEKKLQEKYEKENKIKKTAGCSVTDKPAIYNIETTEVSANPIRLIDTAGFGDVRGENYDIKITKDIQELFTKEIETLNSICLIFKATETRAHDRAKLVLDKLFSLFGQEIQKNIVIVFTFVDDFDMIPALKTLTDEKSPFFNILGNINNLPHFEFNNQAFFSKDKEKWRSTYETNTNNFGKLLEYVFKLTPISLQSSREVIQKRFDISNYILNICGELSDVIKKIKSSIDNRDNTRELKKKLEEIRESPYNQIKVKKIKKENYTETFKEDCASGWYTLYCKTCDKYCHRDCRGSNEGFHSDEYGCKVIGTFSRSCSYCDCHYSKHEFRNYIMKTRTAVKDVEYETYEDDPKSKANEEQKKQKREMISKDIEKNEIIMNNLDNEIHNSLTESLNKLSIIATKEKELNKIALKKYDNIKYGYCKKILDETIQEKNIKNVFNQTLDDIETICSNDESKENSIDNIQNLLLNC